MFKINDNYQKLPGSYLFSTIAKKVGLGSHCSSKPGETDHPSWYR